jgi:hypothetical protein
MPRQLELDINRPAWHDINYEPTVTKTWAERAKQLAHQDKKKTTSLTDVTETDKHNGRHIK